MKNIYIQYFKYLCEHKKNVFKECMKMSKEYKWVDKLDLIIHGFTHDMSKFNPIEFIPYAKWFYGIYGVRMMKDNDKIYLNENTNYLRTKFNFKFACKRHCKKNKHHNNYWVYNNIPYEMDVKSIRHMVCDWNAMGIKFGDTAKQYYLNNYNKIQLNIKSRLILELLLGIEDNSYLGDMIRYYKDIHDIDIIDFLGLSDFLEGGL